MSQSQPGASSPRFRRGRIPGTMVLNWQPPETQASKPLIRRPMTACEACRAAKVKCNGQRTCERCRNRGLCCTYAPPPGTRNGSREGTKNGNVDIGVESTAAKSSPRNSHGMSTASLSTSQATTDPMAVDTSPGDIFSIAGGGTGATLATNTASGLEHWQEETFNQALEQFDWVFPESSLSLTPSQDSGRNDFDLLQNPPERTASSTSDAHTRRSEASTEATGLSPQTPSSSANSNCQCRVNMMAHIPRLECAIQETPKPQLDKIFKVTGDVIRSCLESTRCGCYVGPVDLVCIMTVFEQTAACFDYIAKSGFDGTVKVGIGDYCVSLTDDASLKRMLVLDLVTQANELLDSISARAQDMFVAQHEPGVKRMGRSPACLNQLNLDYVREATASFKKLFRLITDFFGENHSQK